MHRPHYRRHSRLAGVMSLFDIALRGWPSRRPLQKLPTSARMRRDIGLPALDDRPDTHMTFNIKP